MLCRCRDCTVMHQRRDLDSRHTTWLALDRFSPGNLVTCHRTRIAGTWSGLQQRCAGRPSPIHGAGEARLRHQHPAERRAPVRTSPQLGRASDVRSVMRHECMTGQLQVGAGENAQASRDHLRCAGGCGKAGQRISRASWCGRAVSGSSRCFRSSSRTEPHRPMVMPTSCCGFTKLFWQQSSVGRQHAQGPLLLLGVTHRSWLGFNAGSRMCSA